MNDIPHERLTDGLRASADAIDVGDADEQLVDIRQRAKRRTNRRRAAIGSMCAVALVGGIGAVVVNDDGDGDIVRSADVVAEPADDSTVDPAPVPATTAPPTTAPVPEAAAESALAEEAAIPFPLDGPQWLVPWRDGFLAGSAIYLAPILPAEVAPELATVFSQEVLDLIVPDLPMSIDEAFERISTAGFDDQIEAAFNENPEVFDAIYGDPTPPTIEFEFSNDGIDWEPVEFALPEGVNDITQIVAVDDRLVVLSQSLPITPSDDSNLSPEVSVHSTTDLTTWTSQVVPSSTRDDLPDVVKIHQWPRSIAVQNDRWMVAVESHIEVDVESLVSDEVRDRMGREGWGYTPTSDGMTVELYDEEGSIERISFTWDELGVPVDLIPEISMSGVDVEVWTAAWDDIPTPTAPPFASGEHGGSVIAAGDGFMATGSSAVFSVDGTAWEPMDGAPPEAWVSTTMAVDDGVVAFTDGPLGSAVYLIGSDLAWTPIEIPGAPDAYYPAFGEGTPSGAVVVDAGGPDMPEPQPEFDITLVDGDRSLVIREEGDGQSYELLDADGTVLVSERFDYNAPPPTSDIEGEYNGPFEFLLYGDIGGLTVVSPDDGSVLFEVDQIQLSDAYNEVFGSGDLAMEMEEPQMDLWLLATANGTDWLVEQIDSDAGFWFVQSARNGSTVLASTGAGWLTYELP